jgi:hypothetical protein
MWLKHAHEEGLASGDVPAAGEGPVPASSAASVGDAEESTEGGFSAVPQEVFVVDTPHKARVAAERLRALHAADPDMFFACDTEVRRRPDYACCYFLHSHGCCGVLASCLQDAACSGAGTLFLSGRTELTYFNVPHAFAVILCCAGMHIARQLAV